MIITENTKEKAFEPYTLNITFESVEELKVLWFHLNMSGAAVKDANKTSSLRQSLDVIDEHKSTLTIQYLWNTIECKLKELGEK